MICQLALTVVHCTTENRRLSGFLRYLLCPAKRGFFLLFWNEIMGLELSTHFTTIKTWLMTVGHDADAATERALQIVSSSGPYLEQLAETAALLTAGPEVAAAVHVTGGAIVGAASALEKLGQSHAALEDALPQILKVVADVGAAGAVGPSDVRTLSALTDIASSAAQTIGDSHSVIAAAINNVNAAAATAATENDAVEKTE